MSAIDDRSLPVLLATAGKGLAMVGITPVDTCLCREGAPLLPFDAVEDEDSAVAPPVVSYAVVS